MLPALLASIGLPLLTKWIGGALETVDHPAAQVAADALKDVGAAIGTKQISAEQLAEANRHVERQAEIDADETKTIIAEINTTIRAESQSEDEYVRRWRPKWGYVTAETWRVQTYAIVLCMVAATGAALMGKGEVVKVLLDGAANLVSALSIQWSVALGVLGVAVVKRSQDKQVAAGSPPAPGILGAIVDRIGGGRG